MPLNCNFEDGHKEPEGSGDWVSKPGIYTYKVDEAEEVTFKSGNQGLKLKLLVNDGAPWGDSKCFENIVYGPNSTWRLKALCRSIGVEYSEKLELWDLEGRGGRAKFKVEEYNGYQNLKVGNYIIKEGQTEAPVTAQGKNPAPESDIELCPF